MIKLTYAAINDFNMTNALAKLATTPGLPLKTAYRLAKLHRKVEQELEVAKKIFREKLLLPNFLKDEQGNLVGYPEGHPQAGQPQVDPAKKAEYDKAYAEFLEVPVQIDLWKIPVEEIERAGLSGRELMALEPILDGLEEYINSLPADASA